MLDRAFTFSDPTIIRKLQTEFIPAVGNTHELQNQKSPAANWFMGMARVANPRVLQGVTSQGFYVAGPDGKAYAFNNNRDPQRVLDMMERTLTEYRKDPPKPVTISAEDIEAPFCKAPSEASTTVRVFSRILPLPKDADVLNHGVARDHLWVYKSDIEAILGKEGRFPMPNQLANRIARYHLVDNVRGEPDFWKASEVRSNAFEMWPIGKNRFGLKGTYSMATADGRRGLKGSLEGEITVEGATLKKFLAYGDAKAWGAGTYTPRPPAGEFPVKFAFIEVNDEASRFTPPQAALYGDAEYRRGN